MDKRFVLWIVLSFVVILANFWVQMKFFPPAPPKAPVAKNVDVKPPEIGNLPDGKKPEGKTTDGKKPAEGDPANLVKPAENGDVPKVAEAPAKVIEPAWLTLGSADPESPYRMLVTLTNRGAAVERIELNSEHYRDVDDRSGYLGQLDLFDSPNEGATVRVVGPGTPAEKAGLKIGDTIKKCDDKVLLTGPDLALKLKEYNPGRVVVLTVERDDPADKQKKRLLPLSVTLIRRPLEVVRPEKKTYSDKATSDDHDPLSLLMTFEQIGGELINPPNLANKNTPPEEKEPPPPDEIAGLHLRDTEWEVVSEKDDPKNDDNAENKSDFALHPNPDHEPEVLFRHKLPNQQLKVLKRFRLAHVPDEQKNNEVFKAYHLRVMIDVQHLGTAEKDKPQTISYRLDGPTGLPTEGAWYATKKGLRDVATQFQGGSYALVNCSAIVKGKPEPKRQNEKLDFYAVDAQYFAAALLSNGESPFAVTDAYPIYVGAKPEPGQEYRGNTSFRLISLPTELKPGETISHELTLFAGPKKPDLLEQYSGHKETGGANLSNLVDYGWFGFVSRPMLALLRFFYGIIPNYGIAIIMLTVFVRACMFPISKRQALGAQKMQLIQPEMKAIKEKCKGDNQAMQKAMSELYRKHNYHPLSGCLPMFVQLPIFIGLYSGLRLNVDLRQEPLFGNAIQWCSNLASPDMLFRWDSFVPAFLSRESGMFSLGPFFNLFPCITILLFIVQQKMFMPPATDEQSAMQQSMMKYMMVFMGFTFYCVPCGLCLYFIVSTSWGIIERKLLPRVVHAPVATATVAAGKNRKKKS